MIESAAGETSAPPSPCKPRATSSIPSDCETPQMSDAPENSAMPAMNSRRRPSASASRPPSSRKPPKISVYAFSTHDRLCSENPRLVWIVGSATFTTVASSTTMNCATATSASTRFELTRGASTASSRDAIDGALKELSSMGQQDHRDPGELSSPDDGDSGLAFAPLVYAPASFSQA